jgi:membrane protein implicated in regulation of membrane protease activity
MNDRNAYPNNLAVPHGDIGALFACGMWLRVGLVGAFAAVAGIIALVEGDGTPLSALAFAAGGAALAVFGWRRAYAAIDTTEARTESAADATSTDGRTHARA